MSTTKWPSDFTGQWSRRSARFYYLDAFRGLAILAMMADHFAGLAGDAGHPIRLTVGRVAMPMFFLLSGYLFRRLSWRHAGIFAAGAVIPLAVPWIDRPNVLVWYAVGCCLLALERRAGVPLWLIVALALGLGANHWPILEGVNTYDPVMLWGLMALGTMLTPRVFEWAGRAPAWVACIGRAPLRWYLGHLLVLEYLVLPLAVAHGR